MQFNLVCWCCYGQALCLCVVLFFLFKQKTAYEMRISDWSSDVCSSDLCRRASSSASSGAPSTKTSSAPKERIAASFAAGAEGTKIGRASCRERVGQYV